MGSQREDTSRPERGLRSHPPERLPWRHPISGSRRLPLRREPLALSATRVRQAGLPACNGEHHVYVGNLPARGRRRLGTSHPETRPTAPVRTSQLDGGTAVFGREGPWALRRRGRSVRGVVPVVSFSPAGAAPEFRSTSRPRSPGRRTRREAPHTPGPRSNAGCKADRGAVWKQGVSGSGTYPLLDRRYPRPHQFGGPRRPDATAVRDGLDWTQQ